MSIAHGIRTLGVLGAGQMGENVLLVFVLALKSLSGTGIALVAAIRAKVPVLLHDRSHEQIHKGLALIDSLLAKDVSKGRIQSDEAKAARERVQVVPPEAGLAGLRDVDMVIEVCISISQQFS
jgi:3-hydroxybutyryl-CoA dehydrogenase